MKTLLLITSMVMSVEMLHMGNNKGLLHLQQAEEEGMFVFLLFPYCITKTYLYNFDP